MESPCQERDDNETEHSEVVFLSFSGAGVDCSAI